MRELVSTSDTIWGGDSNPRGLGYSGESVGRGFLQRLSHDFCADISMIRDRADGWIREKTKTPYENSSSNNATRNDFLTSPATCATIATGAALFVCAWQDPIPFVEHLSLSDIEDSSFRPSMVTETLEGRSKHEVTDRDFRVRSSSGRSG